MLYVLGLIEDPADLLDYVTENSDVGSTMKYLCTICGKGAMYRKDARNHVENIHFPNQFSYQCDICNIKLKSKTALHNHNAKNHKYSVQLC